MKILITISLICGLFYTFYRIIAKFVDDQMEYLKKDMQEKLKENK